MKNKNLHGKTLDALSSATNGSSHEARGATHASGGVQVSFLARPDATRAADAKAGGKGMDLIAKAGVGAVLPADKVAADGLFDTAELEVVCQKR